MTCLCSLLTEIVNYPTLKSGACKAEAEQARLTSLSHRTP